MKYIKTYEEIQIEPQIGDYVIALDSQDPNLNVFLSNSIGKIISMFDIIRNEFIHSHNKNGKDYLISYENIPDTINPSDFRWRKNSRPFFRKEIQYFSPNKKDVESYIIANKFNL